MKKLMAIMLVLGFLVTGCGAHLALMNYQAWQSIYKNSPKAMADPEQFKRDHDACSKYSANMTNIPFMDFIHQSTGWYEVCMEGKGYKKGEDKDGN